MQQRIRSFYKLLIIVFLLQLLSKAQPGDYYNTINVSNPTFVDDLKTRIRSPYTKVSYDNFDETNVANYASYNKGDGTRGVVCVYSGYEFVYSGTFAWTTMSREHTWCHSWMPTYSSTSGNEYADQHHLFPTHQNSANGVRSNHPLGEVVTVTSSFLEGKYGKDANNNNVYEPRDSHKGDAARAILYMALRYDDVNGNNWDFNWLNNTRLPYLNEAPQDLNLLLSWHQNDPPDTWEIGRNDYIQSIQQNRNPFIDHPEYVDYIDFNEMTYKSSSSNTSVSFASAGATKNENGGSYSISLSITNRSITNSTSADVVLISGNASDIGNYTTQTVTFPANSSITQTVNISITDNNIEEDDKEFVFELQNINGGENAMIGNNPTFRLTVVDDERRLFISEISDANRFTAEFVEIYNGKNREVDASGYILKQFNSAQTFTIPSETIIPAHGFLVIGRDTLKSGFENYWGVTFDTTVVYINSGNKIPLINGNEKFSLKGLDNINIDPKINNDTTFLGHVENRRIIRVNHENDINSWQSLLLSSSPATPGRLEPAQVLPVELNSFNAKVSGKNVELTWSTAAEINNYGFNVERTSVRSSNWEVIGFVGGAGNSNSPKEYSFVDDNLQRGKFSYRLKQIDNDGKFSYSQIINIEIRTIPTEFALYQNYPNPFNPTTKIKYSISSLQPTLLKVYDVLGNEVVLLVSEIKEPGEYEIEWNASNLSSGIYFYKLQAGDFISTKKFVLMK
jgi:endonuclease I